MPSPRSSSRKGPEHWIALGFVFVAHLALGWWILQLSVVQEALREVLPIMVNVLPPEVEPPPPPKVEPPKVRPKVEPPPKPAPATPPPVVEPPLITAPADARSSASAPPPPAIPQPLPPIGPVTPPASPAPAPAPIPITPPDLKAAYLDNPQPRYPQASMRRGEQGRVMLRVFVTPEGRVERVEIITSSGYPRLDHAAEEEVQRWKFTPARQGDKPVAASVSVPIDFRIE
jgi:protein TonB